MEEIFKDIPGWEGLYQVSNRDNVKSLNYNNTGKEHVLKPKVNKYGYITYTLSKKGKKEYPGVHRLKALAFIPVPERLKDYDIKELIVHHINECKSDNRLENLVWLTDEEHREIHRQSELTKKKIGAVHKGKKISEEQRAKLSAAHKGKKLSPEHIAKVIASLNKPVEAYDDDGNVVFVFPSEKNAVEYGFISQDISSCCLGKRKTHRGLHWRYIH